MVIDTMQFLSLRLWYVSKCDVKGLHAALGYCSCIGYQWARWQLGSLYRFGVPRVKSVDYTNKHYFSRYCKCCDLSSQMYNLLHVLPLTALLLDLCVAAPESSD